MADTIQAARDTLARWGEGATPIEGFPGYWVTPDGHVLSESNWRGYGCREITPVTNSYGYLKVRLTLDGRRYNRTVHGLVARAFLSARHAGNQVRHLNGDQRDNRASNLAWGTARENAQDRDGHNTTAWGVGNGQHKLTPDDVRAIRQLRLDGVHRRDVAARFGVHPETISDITSGDTWTRLDKNGESDE